MATTLIPPAPQPRPRPGGEVLRFVSVRANLLPPEVLSARQTTSVRRRVLIGLVAVVALLAAGYAASWWQTSQARDDLDTAQRQGDALQSQITLSPYQTLVRVQGESQSTAQQLRQLMTSDLPWSTLLAELRAKAPSGVVVTAVTGSTTTSGAGSSGSSSSVIGVDSAPAVGELIVNGTAPDKNAIAAYSDALDTLPGLDDALITSVMATTTSQTFTISLAITDQALGGRFTTTSTGGR